MAISSYTKQIKLDVVVNKSTLQEAEEKFNQLKFNDLVDEDTLAKMKKTFIEAEERTAKIKELEKQIALYRKTGNTELVNTLTRQKEQLEKEQEEAEKQTKTKSGDAWWKDNSIVQGFQKTIDSIKHPIQTLEKEVNEFSDKFVDSINNAVKKIGQNIKSFCSDIVDSVKEQLTTLSQLMGISTTNVDINSQKEMLQYGLSSQDYYALTSAMSDMGLSGSISDLIDDMYYMSDEQVERLLEKVDYYGETYGNADVEMLEDYNEFQETWQDFKQGLTDTLIKFLSDNKDTLSTVFDLLIDLCNTLFEFVADIMPILNVIMEALNGILKAVSWMIGGGNNTSTASTDLLASRSVYNTNTDTDNNITITNNFTSAETQTEYSNIGQDVANQVIAALQ